MTDLPEIATMTPLSLAALQTDFDAIIERAEAGEYFLISSDHGRVVLMPYRDYAAVLASGEPA